ncbi:MAG: hypothetical protein WCL29_04030, partial [Pseudomonadota bacterium]
LNYVFGHYVNCERADYRKEKIACCESILDEAVRCRSATLFLRHAVNIILIRHFLSGGTCLTHYFSMISR